MSVWLPPAEYLETIPRATGYACLYFTDTGGRPVQLRATYSTEIWQWPGGNMDHGETPWECALRECLEETGIAFEGERRLLGTQFIADRGEAWPANHIGFLFDGGTLTDEQIAAIVLDPEEHSEVRVQSVREWEALMTPANFARLREIDAARRTGTVAYMEH
ncbi:NUDIX domain-containing protein [Streptomyces sp. ZAF1911]|uniref:NUDIX domain-containing protein n=1 Tax=Streptomyces sp. ZAF1911 TaxID=2944129 RepID=UPI00237B4F71|nr:NUDIX domain-containing protein [Streptomyces sp. ZAF1911]MDD9380621.1 NUDIX domain-containing protein [Streptomyces sp. ZAF1911]